VLDIGCGADQALIRILCHHPGRQPKLLVGVDYDDVKKRWDLGWFKLLAPLDFTKDWRHLATDGPYDVITCFEVIEHMQKAHGRKLLRGARELMADGGKFLLSTPVYDGRQMAQNHIHEYYAEELETEIHRAGLTIERRFGTFQTVLQAKKAEPAHRKVWEELRAYYSDDVLACFIAPLYPDAARNNLWVLTK
jgi:2-polyprenyl-3-methyl-5-hydroxy-6-metoxy-1,4-benzoquinol methylase